jgi:hypothetical protein
MEIMVISVWKLEARCWRLEAGKLNASSGGHSDKKTLTSFTQ